MRKISIYALSAAAALTVASLYSNVRAAAPVVDGTLDAAIYGPALSTQTVNTGFGDSTIGNGTSSGGSELDAAYGTVQNGNLYIFLSGNFESNGNHFNLFIADGRSGQNTLAATGSSGNLSGSNGLTFPAGFNATYALDANDFSNTFFFDQYDLVHGTGNYIGSVPLTGGIGNNQNLNGIAIGVNNTNAAGVNGSTGTAADPVAADAVSTGLEVEIPLAALGNPTGSIQFIADINNNNNNYLSNQFLGGLPVGYGNLGTASSVNLNGIVTPVSITIPNVPNGTWLSTGSGNWSSATNWSNSVVPNGAGVATVFAAATSASTVTVDGAYTVGSITFNSQYPYTLAAGAGGSLTLNNNGSSASITNYSGSQTISAPLVLASNTTVTAVSHGDSITLSGNISGSGSLTTFDQGAGGTQFSPSLVALGGSNTYTGGTIVDGGNLQLQSAAALPANSVLTLDAHDVPAGTLDINGYNISLSRLIVTTGPNTVSLGAAGHIINSSATAGTATITYAGSTATPDSFYGIISDSASSGGGVTAFNMVSGSLTFNNSNYYTGATTVSGGTLTLAAAGALPTGTNLNIAGGAAVVDSNINASNAISVGTLSVVGKLDLTNNGLIVHSGTLAAVTSLIKSGFSGGTWNGSTGITSSTAAADSTSLTALGVLVNDNGSGTPLYGSGGTINATFNGTTPADGDILVKYTYYGDANLDGAVDGSDYTLIDNGFSNNLTGWSNGDFNYDGKIDGSDYTLIDNAFNTQGASLGSNPAAQLASTTAQIAGGAAVPEPASIGTVIGVSMVALLRRRRSVSSL